MIETEPSGADTLVVGRPIRKVLGWGVIAAITAAALARASTSEALRLLGLPDPGPLTIYGLPAVMAFGEVAAVMTVGSLLLAAVLVPPQASGVLDVDGYLALRTASVAAAIWAVCAALLVPLTLSDSSGQPLSSCSPIQGCSLARFRTSMSQLHGHGPQGSHSCSRLRVV